MATSSPRSRPSNRREIVLDRAAELFARRGYEGSALYRHLPNQEAILGSVILADLYDPVDAQVQVHLDEAVARAAGPDEALDRMLAAYCRIAFDADLIVVVTENRRAIRATERPRLRWRERRIIDLWRAVVGEVRADLRVGRGHHLDRRDPALRRRVCAAAFVDAVSAAVVTRLVGAFVRRDG